jgi:amino-acid N-acetyltransferase
MVRGATSADTESIERLLVEADLPVAGVADALDEFLVAEEAGRVVAAAGLERYGDDALLRSVVVDRVARGRGVARHLVDEVLARAAARGVGDVYLLTTTAEGWFAGLGFEPVDRVAVPPAVRASAEFASICPASAAVMRRRADSRTAAATRPANRTGGER